MAAKGVPPASLFSPCLIPPSLPLFSLPPSPSPSEDIPSWSQASFSPQLPTPSFDLPPLPCAPRAEGKEQWRGEGRRAGEKGFPGQVGGENGVSCTEEQMEGAVGDGAWADTSRKNLI